MPKLFKSKIALSLAAIVLAVGLYALLGFVLAPRLIRSALLEDIPKIINVKPTVGEIRFNPFKLDLEVKDFALASPAGEKLIGFDRLFVDFLFSSLWHRAYTFGAIEIDAPVANARMARGGTLNLLALRPKEKPVAKAVKSSEPLPAIRVGSFKVIQGSVNYLDESRPSKFDTHLQPITFELKDFTTGVAGGVFAFTGVSKLGEKIEWHGHLSLQPIESDGEFRVDGLKAHTIWDYLEDQLNFVINSGSIDVEGTYKFTLTDVVGLHVDVAKVGVSDLAIRPKDSDDEWIRLTELTVSGTSLELAKRQAHVESVAVNGLQVKAWLAADGSINLKKLAGTSGTTAAPTAAARPSPAPAPAGAASAAAGPPWEFTLGEFAMHEGSIALEDRTIEPAVKALLEPLSVRVKGVSLDMAKPVHLEMETHINKSGSLSLNGEVTPQPLSAALSMKLAGLDLTAIEPYIARQTSMTLRSGRLSAESKLDYGAPGKKPAIKFAGDVHVDGVRTVDDALHEDFVNWDRVDILGLDYEQGPDRLEIAQVVMRKLYARMIIESDSSLNVKRVMTAPGASPAAAAAPATTEPVSVAKKGDARRSKANGKAVPAKPAVAATAPAVPAAPAAAAMPISVKKVSVQQGRVNFSDLSVAPHFSAGINQLEGSVLGLSSNPKSRAKVDLHGSVDAYSPVSIVGELNVLGSPLYADMELKFNNIELTIFNPYSGKFAGYNISKGKLTTELHYKVDGRKLDAEHHVLIDQLEFGDKTPSKDAVSLPVKLAVALLKDRHGVIDLNLPVSGTLDDPKFRLAPIIWKVLVNILEKAVTAPFALLGALFGGGPDLEFVDFQPGASSLDPAAADKLKAVAKALDARPQLKIEVPIAVVADIDRPALAAAQFNSQLSDIQAASASRKKGAAGVAPPAFDTLDPAAKLEVLGILYKQTTGADPHYPDDLAKGKPKAEVISAKIDFLTNGIHEHEQVGDAELKALGEQRAMALQQALLADKQIAPERVFLVANNKATAKDGAVRLQLALQ